MAWRTLAAAITLAGLAASPAAAAGHLGCPAPGACVEQADPGRLDCTAPWSERSSRHDRASVEAGAARAQAQGHESCGGGAGWARHESGLEVTARAGDLDAAVEWERWASGYWNGAYVNAAVRSPLGPHPAGATWARETETATYCRAYVWAVVIGGGPYLPYACPPNPPAPAWGHVLP